MATIGSNTTIIASTNDANVGLGTDVAFHRFFANNSPGTGITESIPIIHFSRHITDAANITINANVVAGANTAADDATWLVEMNRQLEYRRITKR